MIQILLQTKHPKDITLGGVTFLIFLIVSTLKKDQSAKRSKCKLKIRTRKRNDNMKYGNDTLPTH